MVVAKLQGVGLTCRSIQSSWAFRISEAFCILDGVRAEPVGMYDDYIERELGSLLGYGLPRRYAQKTDCGPTTPQGVR